MIEQHVAAMAWMAMAQSQPQPQLEAGPPPMAGAGPEAGETGLGPEGVPVQGQAPAGPVGPGGGPGAGGSPLGGNFMIIIIIGMVIMVVFMSMSQRKERKKREALLAAIKKNDRVQTTGGMIGRVVEVKADEIVLKVDEATNTRLRFSRGAIQNVLKEAPGEVVEG